MSSENPCHHLLFILGSEKILSLILFFIFNSVKFPELSLIILVLLFPTSLLGFFFYCNLYIPSNISFHFLTNPHIWYSSYPFFFYLPSLSSHSSSAPHTKITLDIFHISSTPAYFSSRRLFDLFLPFYNKFRINQSEGLH